VIVPTQAAAQTLRTSLEQFLISERAVIVLPELLTRRTWYERMHRRLGGMPMLLNGFEREVLFHAAAREGARDCPSPFRLRAGLIPAIMEFHDAARRRRVDVATFERRAIDELGSADGDRGVAR
jgi:hypothetical protein